MQIVGDHLGSHREEVLELGDHPLEVVLGGGIVQVADVLTHVGQLIPTERNRRLHLRPNSEDLRPVHRKR